MVVPIRKWRWIAGVVVALLIVAAGALLLARRLAQPFLVRPMATVLPADGRERAVLRIARLDGGPMNVGEMTAEALEGQATRGQQVEQQNHEQDDDRTGEHNRRKVRFSD